jgi:exosortase E/protease (VPEID-CTERM system)
MERVSVSSERPELSTCELNSCSLIRQGTPFSRNMSTIVVCRSPVSLPYGRWACLLALLAGEALVMTVRFDGDSVAVDRPLYALAAHAGSLTRLVISVGLATLLVASPSWYRVLKLQVGRLEPSRGFFSFIALNLLSFASFFGLSVATLEGSRAHQSEWALIVAGAIAGTATLAFVALAAIPADFWWPLFKQSGSSLVLGPVFGVMAFASGHLAADQWKNLSQATLRLVASILRLIFTDVVCQPDDRLVGSSSFQVEIAPGCSGYEGIGMVASFLCVSLWIFRRDLRLPRALLLVPIGMAVIWLANAFRIALLVCLGTWGYPELALGGFHSLAGWILFLLIALGLIAWARQSRIFSTANSELHDGVRVSPAAADGAYLMPAMAIIATAMVTAILSPGFDRYYPARVVTATVVLLFYRKSYSELRFTWTSDACLIGCGVFLMWVALEPAGASRTDPTPLESGLAALPPAWNMLWLGCRIFGSVITVPLAEELAFRGYLTRRYITSDFQSIAPGRMTWLSFLLSSFLFGALHGRFIAGTLAGMAYALAYRRRGELSDAVVAHGVTNLLIAILVLTTGSWSLW